MYTENELVALQKENRDRSSMLFLGLGTILPKSEDTDILPEIGKDYYVYDDGKIKPSREYKIKIVNIIDTKNLPNDIRNDWEDAVINLYWLFLAKEGKVIVGEIIVNDNNYDDVEIDNNDDKDNESPTYEYFAKTIDGGWFSFTSNEEVFIGGGRLDITGKLREYIISEYLS